MDVKLEGVLEGLWVPEGRPSMSQGDLVSCGVFCCVHMTQFLWDVWSKGTKHLSVSPQRVLKLRRELADGFKVGRAISLSLVTTAVREVPDKK